MNRKGFFTLILALGGIGLLVYAYIVLQGLHTHSGELGERQESMLRIYEKAERDLLYVDKSAEYSLNTAILSLNSKGGYDDEACGNADGYAFWQTKEKNCIPDHAMVTSHIILLAGKQFSSYLSGYAFYQFPADNYDYFITHDDKVHFYGIALQNLLYSDDNMKYSIKPSFHTSSYDLFSHYDEAKKIPLLTDAILKCEQAKALSECVTEQTGLMSSPDYEWSVDCDNKMTDSETTRIFAFCITPSSTVMSLGEKIALVKPTLKFALYIADVPPAPIDVYVDYPEGMDKSVLLSWDTGEADIDHYNLYFSASSLIGTKTGSPGRIELSSATAYSDEPGTCSYTNVGQPCQPAMQKGVLYEKDGRYYYLADILQKIYYAATGVDKNGNEIEEFTKESSAEPVDKLAPGKPSFVYTLGSTLTLYFSAPQYNADGSFFSGNVAYSVFAKDGCDGIIDPQYYVTDTTNPLEISPKTCVAVIARDAFGNPMTVDSISATEKEMIVKEEYADILDDLAMIKEIT